MKNFRVNYVSVGYWVKKKFSSNSKVFSINRLIFQDLDNFRRIFFVEFIKNHSRSIPENSREFPNGNSKILWNLILPERNEDAKKVILV